MSIQVKNSLLSFYLTKKYKNTILTTSRFKEIFKHIHCLHYECLASPIFFKRQMIKEGIYQVNDVFLMTRDSYIKSFPNKPLRYCLVGTNLIPIRENEIPWWKLKKFGNENSKFYEDILPEHINKKLKYRDEILQYLSFLKKTTIRQIQLTLPGFE